MIEARGLTKRYGNRLAVDGLSFRIGKGLVTGFLGPNGAGKTTTMRLILGLDAPTSGTVTVAGLPFARLPSPMRTVGALLEAKAVHPQRSARDHLLCQALSNGIPRRRVDEVLALVGLEKAGRRKAGRFSLGMGQRLGIATALLGDPDVLIFDEPVNGLDPEGVLWMRHLMRELAAEGRTVLVSSHLMSEMALTADHLLIIGRGRLIADVAMEEFIEEQSRQTVFVRTARADDFGRRLTDAGATVRPDGTGALVVSGLDSAVIGELAAADAVPLVELTPQKTSLEEAFMALTHSSVEYTAREGDLG
ncbi:ABC transporter ATP-binding protein [Streptomyces sp. NBC_00370]|uniref:ABC transporter ATP-binding protein n=1 Tax=Streptomyces sp. NBC_00370 TaxID=2975728 RepID=UPI002E265B20